MISPQTCAECGEKRACNPDNDCCAQCEKHIAMMQRLDRFLESYNADYMERLFGPAVYRKEPRFPWQFGFWKNREMQKRLKRFGLPALTSAGRHLWHIQPGQMFNEDAGGYLRRLWAVALGTPTNPKGDD